MGYSIYKQRDIYYISVRSQGKRIKRSLGVSSERQAKIIAKKILPELMAQMITGEIFKPKKRVIPKDEMIERFLEHNHGWKPKTKEWYSTCLKKYFKDGLPYNPSYRAMVVRAFNKFINWAEHHNYHMGTLTKLEGGRKWERRLRVFNDEELDLLLNEIRPEEFKLFVQFAYYTGCRRMEICSMDPYVLKQSKVITKGREYRIIKINEQAHNVLLKMKNLWNYKIAYPSQRFKKEARRLGIKDARFHDIRTTFAYNLIVKQKIPIFEVSQLLGHSNVLTTQNH